MKRIDILKNVLLTATMVGASLSVMITIRGVLTDTDHQRTPLSGISYSASPVSVTSSKSGGSAHRVSGGAPRRAAVDVLPTVNPVATHKAVAVSASPAQSMSVAAAPSGNKMATAHLVSNRTSSASAGGLGSAGASYGASGGRYSAPPVLSGGNVVAINASKSSSTMSEPFADTRPSSTVHQKWGDFKDPNIPEEEITPMGDGCWFLLLCALLCVGVKLYKTSQQTNEYGK